MKVEHSTGREQKPVGPIEQIVDICERRKTQIGTRAVETWQKHIECFGQPGIGGVDFGALFRRFRLLT
ncbi:MULTISPECIES: hypothetical protein [Bradyrhizobium]|uniref:hypothetical protein n=1 Tax=Bradyrhizobium TaxID=374 RepID=UPI001FD898D9|nr:MULTISPECIES: hypothetical protein [Bradyrhizobium]